MTKPAATSDPDSSRSVTMADVAALAGVSTSTVSRVITGSRPVAPALRAVVLGAAEQLDYHINLLGRALRRGRTATVGLLVPDLDNPFFSSLAQHLSTAFEGSAADVLVFSAGDDPRIERRGVESFIGRQVDAVVIIPCDEVESADTVLRAAQGALTIQLDREVTGAQVHYVGCDNFLGMQLISQHIREHVDLSEQPVLYVGAQAHSSSGHERYLHFAEEFPDRPAYLGEFDFSWGQGAVDRLLDEGYTKGTIVTAADIIAIGVVARLLVRGFKVPDDFRVIGFDGVGVARLAHPTLTTIRQPVEEMGRTVLDLISSASIDSKPQHIRVAPELILGASSP